MFGQARADVWDSVKALCQYTAEAENLGFHGILEREEYFDNIWLASHGGSLGVLSNLHLKWEFVTWNQSNFSEESRFCL